MSELSEARRALLQRYLRGGNARAETNSAAAIPKRQGSNPAPLSYSQQQIFLHSQLAGDALIYNEPITIHRHGALDVAALERSFTEIVNRHEAWRTTFAWRGDEAVQIVQPAPAHLAIPLVDLQAHPQPEAEAIRLAKRDALQPFDLAHGPMYRLLLVRLADTQHRLFLTLHHIIFDGVSLYRVLLPELLKLYEAFTANQAPTLPSLPIQYSDYAAWQRSPGNETAPEQFAYWENICTDMPVLDLPTYRPRPLRQTYAGADELLHIPSATTAALKTLSQEQNTTPFMTMTAAFMTLLHGCTGQDDIAIGGVSSGRQHSETMGLLGCFLNTVPIRCVFTKELPFTELLTRVRSATLGALSHDAVPFELLVQRFAPQRDTSRAPLVQVLIVVEPPLDPLPEGWGFTHMDVETGTAKFDLQLGLDDRAEGLAGRFIYNTDLFDRATIQLLKQRWLQLLDRIVAEPTQRICDLTTEIWSDERAAEMPPPEWHGSHTAYPRDARIHELFEQQARDRPSAVALVVGSARLSYGELNQRANQLARRLQKLGVERDIPVGVCMERSTEMIIAFLAILKAGGAYVPLDLSYPAERLAFMKADARIAVLLTQAHLRHSERSGAQSRNPVAVSGAFAADVASDATGSLGFARDDGVICVDTEDFSSEEDADLQVAGSAEDLAYIMYTSGSTGTPKGVAIPHRAVVRLVRETGYASFSPHETFLQLAPISFDASTFEIWGALLNGGKLILMPPAPPTLAEIGRAIGEHGITTLWLTSALFNAMVDERLEDLRSLRQLLAGGDVLSVPHVRKVVRALTTTRLINGYGPTESTTFACCHTISGDDVAGDAPISIGRPIANTTAHILADNLQPKPIGATGELYLGGDGLARGYWQQDELTAEKFIPDPFSNEADARLYKTGDLARWRSDGAIEFLGRADQQMKLRGFRIEPGEIEAALKAQPGVLDSAVVLREDTPDDKRLVGYVVCMTESFAERTMLAALKQSVPPYMVPSAIVALAELPRTANGKLDRRALPPPVSATAFVPPKSALEEKLAFIWAQVLGVERVGRTDNFFALGGHSLLALRLVNQIGHSLGVNIPLTVIFEAPTIAELAQRLENWTASPAPPLAAPIVPVSRAARRIRRS